MMRLADRLFIVMVCLSVSIIIYFLMQTTTVCTFRIPTDSMQPALQPGDNILVNKWVMGARIFDIWEAAEEKEVENMLKLMRNEKGTLRPFFICLPFNGSLAMCY